MVDLKQAIKGIVFFAVLTLVGDRLIGGALEGFFFKSKFRYAMLYEGSLAADIVVLGNSRGVHMFHRPAIESLANGRMVNISFNGVPAVALPVLWADYLDRHPTPKQLMLEVSCVGKPDEHLALERFTVLLGRSPAMARLIRRKNPSVYAGTQLSHIFRFNNELIWRSLFSWRKSDQDSIMNSTVSEEQIQRILKNEQPQFEKFSENAQAISRVVELAEQKGIDVQLILAPYLPAYLEGYQDAVEDWRRWLEEQLGRPIVNYSMALADRSSFADQMHLNSMGATAFAKILELNGHFSRIKPKN